MASKRKKGGSARKANKAERADRHRLYEESVQSVETEIDFLEETFQAIRGCKPTLLREDFCGTANAACRWVKINGLHHAIGVDIDPNVLDWGRKKHLAKLPPEAQQRVELIEGDVLQVDTKPADIIVALNFSYWIFKTRGLLKKYFRQAYENLGDDGLFFVDAFGGSEAYIECEEETDYDSFTYVWDQHKYDPVTGHIICHIHFHFPDGSRMDEAFSYDWRLWTLPEIQEILSEAGFRRSTVYWEGSDEDGEGTGEFEPVAEGEADPAWIAYVVAEK